MSNPTKQNNACYSHFRLFPLLNFQSDWLHCSPSAPTLVLRILPWAGRSLPAGAKPPPPTSLILPLRWSFTGTDNNNSQPRRPAPIKPEGWETGSLGSAKIVEERTIHNFLWVLHSWASSWNPVTSSYPFYEKLKPFSVPVLHYCHSFEWNKLPRCGVILLGFLYF